MKKPNTDELLRNGDIQGILKRYSVEIDDYVSIITGLGMPPFTEENKRLIESLSEIDMEMVFIHLQESTLDVDLQLTKLFTETLKEINTTDQIMIRFRSKIHRWLKNLSKDY